jgi:glutamyl-tRNA synthetase
MADPHAAPAPARPRLRFAPSPTGFLHVGGARTALFNWLYAQHFDGDFLLRIEDTDRARSTDEATRAIFEGLEWLGLSWAESVVYQGAHLERHQHDAQRLLDSGAAYRDDAGIVRFRSPSHEDETAWPDLVHGRIAFPNKDIEDFAILRSDGSPLYNMAVVSDDIAMGITLVMRGDDHISNTPKQILLYHALGAPLPTFAHLPMIHGTDGKKLSKRHGATAVGDYQQLGILPGAMVNFLALLGWSPGGDREILTLPELIELFAPDGLLRKAAVFDPAKLEWMNGQHLSRTPLEELLPHVSRAIVAAGLATPTGLAARADWYVSVVDILRVRSRTVTDLVRQAGPFFSDTIAYDPAAVAKAWADRAATGDLLRAAHAALARSADWTPDALEATLRALAEERGIAAGKLFQPLRVALTGLSVSPGIFDVLRLLGPDRSLARIDAAVKILSDPAG